MEVEISRELLMIKEYRVYHTACYYVLANSEDEAIEKVVLGVDVPENIGSSICCEWSAEVREDLDDEKEG